MRNETKRGVQAGGPDRSQAGVLSRRALLAAGGGVALFAITGRASRALEAPKASPTAWADLERRLSGQLLRPDDPRFVERAKPYNLLFADRRPAGIALCRTEADVATAIRWCRENEVPLAARGGGHNYAGYSTTQGLIIDLGGLRDLRFERESGRLFVGAGLKNGDIRTALGESGHALVHGRCSSVGIAGFLLGGGIGFNMRRNGIGADLLRSSRMVGADSALYTLSDTENPDLFWACRGGAGGNFGINTAFELQTFPVQDITVFHLRWQERPEEVLASLVRGLDGAPDTLGTRIALLAPRPGRDRGPMVDLLGQMYGTGDDVRDLLGPALRTAAPSREQIETLPYWQGQDVLAEHSEREYYRERCRFVSQPLPQGAFDVAFDFARRYPGQHGTGMFKLFQTGGTINKVAAARTAFVHRDSRWLLTVANVWTADESPAAVAAVADWLNAYYEALLPYCGQGAFQNFPDPELKDWAQQYYGTNLGRLRQVKAQVDPTELFRFPQSIRPAGG
ncbi:FAD-binding oxidoreductase [Xanthobacter sp. V0B-10]|uniref:FAD-binding oxidoreductase n=1 Tax=Xanthobacter albus TaxID=3119929 RepID=UPI003727DDBF